MLDIEVKKKRQRRSYKDSEAAFQAILTADDPHKKAEQIANSLRQARFHGNEDYEKILERALNKWEAFKVMRRIRTPMKKRR
ncbi:hypothetical protein [Pantoea sp. ME81]|uniref:hypothetical protein n=1 Tax=Pantoea sp. ME81 TaxID=2743935 RepID=UPI0015F4FB74|nr:hypothetical protein [Pantoea sp. ME81]